MSRQQINSSYGALIRVAISLNPPEMNTSQLLLVSTLGLAVNLFGMFAMGGHHHHVRHFKLHQHLSSNDTHRDILTRMAMMHMRMDTGIRIRHTMSIVIAMATIMPIHPFSTPLPSIATLIHIVLHFQALRPLKTTLTHIVHMYISPPHL